MTTLVRLNFGEKYCSRSSHFGPILFVVSVFSRLLRSVTTTPLFYFVTSSSWTMQKYSDIIRELFIKGKGNLLTHDLHVFLSLQILFLCVHSLDTNPSNIRFFLYFFLPDRLRSTTRQVLIVRGKYGSHGVDELTTLRRQSMYRREEPSFSQSRDPRRPRLDWTL